MSVQDLTNTTWRINDNFTATSGYGIFDIYPSYAEDSEGNIIDDAESYYSAGFYIGYTFNPRTDVTPLSDSIIWMSAIVPPKLFTVGGGTDVTNATLIAWLQANATMQTSQITVDMSSLSGWSNVSAGSHTLTIKAKAQGYRDSAPSTGVSFTKAAGYSVEVTNTSSKYIPIYDGSDENGQYLGDLLGNSTETFTITSGHIFAEEEPTITITVTGATGGVTFDNPATVTGNGTWTLYASHGGG